LPVKGGFPRKIPAFGHFQTGFEDGLALPALPLLYKRRMAPKDFRKDRRSFSRKPSGKPAENAGRREGASEWLYGLHAVQAALANPHRKLGRAILTPRAKETIGPKLLARVPVEIVEPGAIDRLLPPGAVHQGAALQARP